MKIELEKLVLTADNPRHTSGSVAAHEALMASLSTHGLIQPIVVRPMANGDAGKWQVVAGGRRLIAARELGWTEIEAVENDAEYGVSELGAAENMMREQLHPLDECAVISRLVADGEDMETVASRFGQTPRWAEQRIKLNGLSPVIAAAFRAGELTLATAQAYTLVEPKAQEHYFGKGNSEHQVSAHSIRHAFSDASYPAANAIFDLGAYPKEKIRRDLFGDDVWLDDRKAFEELQAAAIGLLKDDLLKEGWNDVVIMMNGNDWKISQGYVRTEGRIAKAERGKFDVLVTYFPNSGKVTVDKGMARRKEADKVKPSANGTADSTKPEEVKALTPDDLTGNQMLIVGALQTAGIEEALVTLDLHTALVTLIGPLLRHMVAGETPPWCGNRSHALDYKKINELLSELLEPQDDADAVYKIPSREALSKMTLEELTPLLCNAALRSMTRIHMPSKVAQKQLKDADIQWMAFDKGFLKRYRLDQLTELAKRLHIDLGEEPLSKPEMVELMETACKELDLDRTLKIDYV